MDREMKMFFMFVVSILALLVWVIIAANQRECNVYGEMTGMETKVVAGECYAKTSNGWFLKNQIRVDK